MPPAQTERAGPPGRESYTVRPPTPNGPGPAQSTAPVATLDRGVIPVRQADLPRCGEEDA
ncbi:hypothetical protein C1708_31640 [Streptomyces sp. DH-12]|nr:hypothetical protein C1708_31640 [Streptomyces sp. DH-12]